MQFSFNFALPTYYKRFNQIFNAVPFVYCKSYGTVALNKCDNSNTKFTMQSTEWPSTPGENNLHAFGNSPRPTF